MPPGQNMDDWCTILRSGLWRLQYKLSAEGKRRFFHEFLPLLHHTKRDVLGARRDHQSWYLVYVGTKPSARGKGYAKKLIQHVTSQVSRHYHHHQPDFLTGRHYAFSPSRISKCNGTWPPALPPIPPARC